jgi:hypothetical protein
MSLNQDRESDVIYTFKKPEPEFKSKLIDLFIWEYGSSQILVKEDTHQQGSRVNQQFTAKIPRGFYKDKELSFHVSEKKYTDSKGTVYRVELKRK